MHFMTEPEELLNWMKEHEEFKAMNKEDAQILLNYINLEQISKYPIDILSDVFDLSDVDYYTGIKLFSDVLNRKGVSLEHQERYELFEKIYEEGMREKRQENTRGERL